VSYCIGTDAAIENAELRTDMYVLREIGLSGRNERVGINEVSAERPGTVGRGTRPLCLHLHSNEHMLAHPCDTRYSGWRLHGEERKWQINENSRKYMALTK
jgi:hypothetical protein